MREKFIRLKADIYKKLVDFQDGQYTSCIGLDGFVDSVIHVVDKRTDESHYTRITKLSEYGNRISAAAGKSLNVELVPTKEKYGGNGINMAAAIGLLGINTNCLGAMGLNSLHPAFMPLEKILHLYSYAEPAETDAIEFLDGKIISSKLSSMNLLKWEDILLHIGSDTIFRLLDSSDIISLNNWTMVPAMTNIWEHLLEEYFPRLSPRKRILFFDLADPQKREASDISAALNTIAKFTPFGDVYISGNERETEQYAKVLSLAAPTSDLSQTAVQILNALDISGYVLHGLKYSTAVTSDGCFTVPGNYTATPIITTGGGDNFNAGVVFGLVSGFTPEESAFLGNIVSGFYVRNGESPTRKQLLDYIPKLDFDS